MSSIFDTKILRFIATTAILYTIASLVNETRGEHRWELWYHQGKSSTILGIKEDGFDTEMLNYFVDNEDNDNAWKYDEWQIRGEHDSYWGIGFIK